MQHAWIPVVLFFCAVADAGFYDLPTLKSPYYIELGSESTLECEFDSKRPDLVYVQWTKDEQVFYKYNLNDTPADITYHNVTGIVVDPERSGLHKVTVRAVSKAGGGQYACEIILRGAEMLETNADGSTVRVLTAEEISEEYDDDDDDGAGGAASRSIPVLPLQMLLVTLCTYFANRA